MDFEKVSETEKGKPLKKFVRELAVNAGSNVSYTREEDASDQEVEGEGLGTYTRYVEKNVSVLTDANETEPASLHITLIPRRYDHLKSDAQIIAGHLLCPLRMLTLKKHLDAFSNDTVVSDAAEAARKRLVAEVCALLAEMS